MSKLEQLQRWLAGRGDAVALTEGMSALEPIGLLVFGVDGECVLASASCRERFGAPPDGVAGLGWAAETDAHNRALVGETVRAELASRAAPAAGAGRAGTAVEATFLPLLDAQGRVGHVAVLFGDVGARDAPLDGTPGCEKARPSAELIARVEAERARLAAIVESSDDAIIGTDLEGIVETWNAGAERTYGWTRDEIRGRPISVLVPNEGPRVVAAWIARLSAGERVPTFETVFAHKDGRPVDVSVSLTLMRDAVGHPLGVASISRDITERKEMQGRLLLADRMLSVGTLASGVAHEINNPLGFILGNLELLAEDVPDLVRALATTSGLEGPARAAVEARLADIEQALADAREGAHRVRTIVRDLKTFSRGDDEARGPVRLERVLESAVSLAWNEIRHRARLVKQFGHVPHVEGNEPRLGQVFLNLLVNAAQAIPEGQADRNEIRIVTYCEGATRVIVEIHDTGVGIAREQVPRIFDPFFTTKPVGVGTGLGLSICHGIVAAYGGDVSVESERGKGSVFRVTLRAADAPGAEPGEHSMRVKPSSARRGRVLVVDDEPMFVAFVVRALAEAYDMVTATSGGEALATLRAGARFDAIVCDLMMPDTTGMDLYAELAASSPSAADAMIFVTGGAFTPRATEFLARVRNARLEKPVDMDRLRALLRSRVG